MAEARAKPNAWLWTILFAVVAALVAGIAHAVIAFYTVTGASFDWLVWHKQAIVEPATAAGGLGLAVFTITLLLSAGVGSITYALAKRETIRGTPSKGLRGKDRSWSEFTFLQSLALAAVGGLFAGLIAFAAASVQVGSVFPSTEGIDGPEFFLLSVALGGLIALVATVRTALVVANTTARGKLVDQSPRGNVISRVQVWSARNAKTVVLVVLLITAGLGYGVTQIHTDVDVADVLPRGNGNTSAAQNVTTEFKSTFTQQVTLQLQKNPDRCRADSQRVLENRPQSTVRCDNITDEVYVRAQEELYQFILKDQDLLKFNIGVNGFYKLINWTLAGGQDADPDAYSLPGTSPRGELQYRQVNETVWRSISNSVTPVIDPSFDQSAALYLVSTEETASTQEIGEAAIQARDNYVQAVADGETNYTVWGPDNPPLFTVDIPVANAHSSALAQEDFVTLFPIIFAFIVVVLYFSFRNFTAIGVAGGALLVAATWTFGTMGWLDIALNTLNLTVLPLILGVGIDFSIHQVTEYANHKREGMSDAEAFRESGNYAGFAMAIATLTSTSGLLVMTVSPSLLMAQLGFLSALGIVSVYLLTITFMPALLTLADAGESMGAKFEPSAFVRDLARNLSQRRVLVALVILIISGMTAVGTQSLGIEEFGEPALNFPEDDPFRQEHLEGLRGFYDLEEGGEALKTNIVVFEGDNTDLQSHRYMESLQAEMAEKENLNMDTSRTLPFLLRTWLTVKDGGPGAAEQISRDVLRTCRTPTGDQIPGCNPVDQADNYPRTREGIQRELDAMFQSPLDTFSSLFIDHPEYNISIMTLATTTGTFEDAEKAWDDVWEAYNDTKAQKPQDLRVSFVGNTATNFLFIEEELPWLSYLGVVSGIVVTLLTIMFTRSIKATLAVLGVVGATSLWWLGILPSVDIGLAITLMLPAVFITSIGSDYAIHMVWNLIKNPDREEVYGVVGKAVLYSMVTTVGAFAIFTQTQNVAASEAMVATVIAIGVMFVATMLVTPLFYPLGRDEDDSLDYVPTTRVVDETPERDRGAGPRAAPPAAPPERDEDPGDPPASGA